MANPQLENGYLKIANEIFDHLISIRIPGEARQVLDVIIRKTYGFNKKYDQIAISQFEKMTQIPKTHVHRALQKLVDMNLIKVTNKGTNIAKTYCLSKNYSEWKKLPKKVTVPKKVQKVTNKGTTELPIKGTTKDTTTKDINTYSVFSAKNPESVKIVKTFIETLDQDCRFIPRTNKQKLEWLKCAKWAINQMGKNGYEKVIDIITFFRSGNGDSNNFSWKDNWLSLTKLKTKNREGILYLDFFWEKIKNKVEYNGF